VVKSASTPAPYLVEHYPHIAAARVINAGDKANVGGSTPGGGDGGDGEGGGGVKVVVTHPDPEVFTYLNEHLSVASLFETIADRLAEDRWGLYTS
jgi:hypothetical protein